MIVEKIKIENIKPAKYNPRKDLKPGDPEYEKLKKSITEFDMVEPLVWNKRTGNLVGGHQRLKILQEMGASEVDVSVVDLPPSREKALNLALNKIQGDWDLPKLKDLLEELDTGDFDMEITGFDDIEIENLMTQFHVPGEGLTPDDEIPGKVETVCKTGDLWQLGIHRLLCGDATKREDVERLMGGEKADMVFTDPPYNVNYVPEERPIGGRARSLHKLGGIQGDSNFDYLAFLELLPVFCKGAFYVCSGTHMWPELATWVRRATGREETCIVWAKNNHSVGRRDYHRKHEFIAYGWFRDKWWDGDRTDTDLWCIDRDFAGDYQHPTQKPVALAERAIKHSCPLHGITLDLFGGSGSTLIACEKLGRRCFMMEIDEHYCDVIIQRWRNFTGKQAVKLNE